MQKQQNTSSSYFSLSSSTSAPPLNFSVPNPFQYDFFDVENSSSTSSSSMQLQVEYQQLYNRYKQCLTHLQNSIQQLETLRIENETLRLSNADLSRRADLLFSQHCLLSDFNRMNIINNNNNSMSPIRNSSPPPRSQVVQTLIGSDQRKSSMPKSIAVRSSGYLKMMNNSNNSPAGDSQKAHVIRQPLAISQRVYVPGSKAEEEALELDVYNQGMTKTELCNKWEETGACPYGENCQFAHGIKELRPVIRHPRYKTEVCRMVLAGDMCPYGHRCHFRHALTNEERLMASPPMPR